MDIIHIRHHLAALTHLTRTHLRLTAHRHSTLIKNKTQSRKQIKKDQTTTAQATKSSVIQMAPIHLAPPRHRHHHHLLRRHHRRRHLQQTLQIYL
jgi:hypothetical protein